MGSYGRDGVLVARLRSQEAGLLAGWLAGWLVDSIENFGIFGIPEALIKKPIRLVWFFGFKVSFVPARTF